MAQREGTAVHERLFADFLCHVVSLCNCMPQLDSLPELQQVYIQSANKL